MFDHHFLKSHVSPRHTKIEDASILKTFRKQQLITKYVSHISEEGLKQIAEMHQLR